MSSDVFDKYHASKLLKSKVILFFGDSNMRAVYKDILWLIEDGTLIRHEDLKKKNEPTFARDRNISNGALHNGRNYQEIRQYDHNPYITFQFITRLYSHEFIQTIENLPVSPDVIVIGSCVWDLTRWGPTGVEEYKKNLEETFKFLTQKVNRRTRIIWTTALPSTSQCTGGFLAKEVEFLRPLLPYNIVEANNYAAQLANRFNIDVLDYHYRFKFFLEGHTKDGIHWEPKYVRYASNFLLTHLALCWNYPLPNIVPIDRDFLLRGQKIVREVQNEDDVQLDDSLLYDY